MANMRAGVFKMKRFCIRDDAVNMRRGGNNKRTNNEIIQKTHK